MGVVLNRLLQTIRFDRDAFVWMEFNDRATGDALIIVAVTEVLFLIAGGTPLFGLVTSFTAVMSSLLVNRHVLADLQRPRVRRRGVPLPG